MVGPGKTAAAERRDRFIPLRKSDILDGLISNGHVDDAQASELRQLARMLGAILHHQYFDELDRFRDAYFDFDPEVPVGRRRSPEDLDAAYRSLADEVVRVLGEANFIEISHGEIERAFAEHALVRVKLKAPISDYRAVRMFRRGQHQETIEVPMLYGLRRRKHEIEVYDDIVLMVATKPDEPVKKKSKAAAWRGRNKIRGGAVLFKYFRHIARFDLEALLPNVRVVMGLREQLTLGVPALVGGVPILLKLASTLTVLFIVAGFYLGLSGTVHDNDTEQALAALSGLFALGAFILRQWGNFHRQSLIHQKQVTDNIYFRNVNNNSGIFNYLIGEAEDQDWKEAMLAYGGLLLASVPLSRAALGSHVEELLQQMFGLGRAFNIDEALLRLREFGLVSGGDDALSALPLPAAIAQLDRVWASALRPQSS
ncbi:MULTISPECIES: TMEM143 family protein [unclassified Bradyrhizobium]|uniref:TMEM143 family protein n=1 Tax=unclassified Bradyrhizobium TaxID=2631580 RepID=UPI0028E65E43|nr:MULTISPECIES: TMEM143 family protein [unclassified Bradyrhizobium]